MRRQLFAGFVAVASQAITIGLVLWLVKNRLGAEVLGLWALILSALSIVRISEFGLGQSLVHHAQIARGEEEICGVASFEAYFRTAFTVTVAGCSLIVAVIYVPLQLGLDRLVDPEYHELVAVVMPIMAVSLITAITNRVPIAALNGLGFFWVGQIAIIVGSVGYGAMAILLVGRFGLSGIAYGHLFMTATTLLIGLAGVSLVRLHQMGTFAALMPFGFDMQILRKMFRLGISIQFTSLMFFFLEPLSRAALAMAGGLEVVGYYEMASRVVVTPREIIARSYAFMSGHFAHLNRTNKPAMLIFYNKQIRQMLALMVIMSAVILIGVFPIADYWVGERHPFFFFSIAAISMGWLSSVPALVPWFWGIGTGNNRYNLTSVALMIAVNIFASSLAIATSSSYLVPIGVGIGILIGEVFLIVLVKRQLASRASWSDKVRKAAK